MSIEDETSFDLSLWMKPLGPHLNMYHTSLGYMDCVYCLRIAENAYLGINTNTRRL